MASRKLGKVDPSWIDPTSSPSQFHPLNHFLHKLDSLFYSLTKLKTMSENLILYESVFNDLEVGELPSPTISSGQYSLLGKDAEVIYGVQDRLTSLVISLRLRRSPAWKFWSHRQQTYQPGSTCSIWSKKAHSQSISVIKSTPSPQEPPQHASPAKIWWTDLL